MTYIIGLTGGIGSGKTLASQWFEQQGICVIDADVVAREVVTPHHPVLEKIQQTFGDWVLLENGELNRRALRDHIFAYPTARQTLEEITHPAIRSSILAQLKAAQSPYAILVSPLLFETKQTEFTHRNLLIDTDEQLQLQRASQRDAQNIEQIQKIIQIQMPREQKQQLADDIVLNDAQPIQLYQQLQHLHQQYLALAKTKKQP